MCRSTAAIEKAGIPTVTVVGTTFVQVAKNAIVGMGFDELPMIVVPQDVLAGQIRDFKPAFAACRDDIVYGLTKWEAKTKVGIREPSPKKFTIEGANYQEAVDRMNALFLKNAWSDGMPLTPPTEERVKWLLTGTDLHRDEVIGTVGPRMGQSTVEAIAINAAMAGARPEYMPVIIAAVKAMGSPEFALGELQATTNPVAPFVIVNGPIAREIGINSGCGLLGPAPAFPAGATIGRALRLILTTVGGAVSGITDMAIHGQPGKYTGLVIAEAEDLSPWDPLHVERGYERNSNTVTALGVMGTTNYCCLADVAHIDKFLEGMAKFIAVPSLNYFLYLYVRAAEQGNAGVLLIPPHAARELAARGWSKEKVKSFLFDKARISLYDFISYISFPFGREGALPVSLKDMPLETMLPVARAPESFIVVVAGADLPYHWQWLPIGHGGQVSVTIDIQLPANWNELLTKR